MPKDYQEEYQPWHEDLQVLMEEYWEVWRRTEDRLWGDGAAYAVHERREHFDKLKAFVTTYGNARELQGAKEEREMIVQEIINWSFDAESWDEWGKENPHIFANELRELLKTFYLPRVIKNPYMFHESELDQPTV